MKPKYPVYIISKGRADTRLTSKALESIDVPYRIVIEPQEYEQYAAVIDPAKILVLPFSNLGQGSIPARNWVWEHSISEGHRRHWIMDDNLAGFCQWEKVARRVPLREASFIYKAEEFVDRYENIAIAGLGYRFEGGSRPLHPVTKPFQLNSRVYSCLLILNSIPFRWRGRYNEDTDLSLRVLKAGWCTVNFRKWMCNKVRTLTMMGGNTDELYVQTKAFDGRLEMAKSLVAQHPDVTKITRKWGRWQHHVDYRPFKSNKLILKSEAKPKPEPKVNFGKPKTARPIG